MSELALASKLNLTHRDLKLALQETVTAPSRVAKIRKTEVEWRLDLTHFESHLLMNNIT
ncbi:hypothetical protein P4S68_08470 [Pseudoalteromonas sp. Hal099]